MALRGTTINPTLSEDATTETEAEKKKGKKGSKKSTGQSAGEGAVAGATTGSVFGPVGTVIGAAIGAGASLVSANKADKATPAGRPERRRLTAALGKVDERKKNRKMALATLSQAVFDWASAIR